MGTLKLDGDCVILYSPTQKIPKVTISQSACFVLTDQQEVLINSTLAHAENK